MRFERLHDWLAARVRFRMRYTRTLEEEIARLRAENRALVNSILGVAEIPPMHAAAVAQDAKNGFVGSGFSPNHRAANGTAEAGLAPPGRPKGRPYKEAMANSEMNPQAAPLRRRSWQQIGRALEIEDQRAARRERESDAETFPAPRAIVPRL